MGSVDATSRGPTLVLQQVEKRKGPRPPLGLRPAPALREAATNESIRVGQARHERFLDGKVGVYRHLRAVLSATSAFYRAEDNHAAAREKIPPLCDRAWPRQPQAAARQDITSVAG